jgi:gas vesicle protein
MARSARFFVNHGHTQKKQPAQMSTSKTLLGALVGLTAGAALGILLAPRSGKETRKLIKQKGQNAQDELSDLLDQGYTQWKKVRNTVVDRANMTKNDIKDFLQFMSAEGSDLKDRVVKDARSTADDMTAKGKQTASSVRSN